MIVTSNNSIITLGTIYDFTGSFDLTFYAAGLLLIMSSIVGFFIPNQLKTYKKQKITTLSHLSE